MSCVGAGSSSCTGILWSYQSQFWGHNWDVPPHPDRMSPSHQGSERSQWGRKENCYHGGQSQREHCPICNWEVCVRTLLWSFHCLCPFACFMALSVMLQDEGDWNLTRRQSDLFRATPGDVWLHHISSRWVPSAVTLLFAGLWRSTRMSSP
jgi:hypothetical protein